MGISYTDLEDGLLSIVEAIVDIPPIQKENERYTPTLGDTYIRLQDIPGVATEATIGITGTDQVSGLYSINCFFKTNIGMTTANDLVSEIVNTYNAADSVILNQTCIRINSAWKLAAITETDWMQIPIQVAWTTYYNRV